MKLKIRIHVTCYKIKLWVALEWIESLSADRTIILCLTLIRSCFLFLQFNSSVKKHFGILMGMLFYSRQSKCPLLTALRLLSTLIRLLTIWQKYFFANCRSKWIKSLIFTKYFFMLSCKKTINFYRNESGEKNKEQKRSLSLTKSIILLQVDVLCKIKAFRDFFT